MQLLVKLFIILLLFTSLTSTVFASPKCSINGTTVFFTNGYDLNDELKVSQSAEKISEALTDYAQIDSEEEVKFSYIFLDRFSYLRPPPTAQELASPVLMAAKIERENALIQAEIQKETDTVRRKLIQKEVIQRNDLGTRFILNFFNIIKLPGLVDDALKLAEAFSDLTTELNTFNETSIAAPARTDLLNFIREIRLAMFTELGLGYQLSQRKVILVTHGESGHYLKQANEFLFNTNYPTLTGTVYPTPYPFPNVNDVTKAYKIISAVHIGTLLGNLGAINRETYRNYEKDEYVLRFAMFPAIPNIGESVFVEPNSNDLGHNFIKTYLNLSDVRENSTDTYYGTLGGIREAAELLESNCGNPPVATFTESVRLPKPANPPFPRVLGNPMIHDFDASGTTDPDGADDIDRYEWYVNNFRVGTFTPAQTKIFITFNIEGSFEVKLKVFDKSGSFGEFTKTVVVINNPPDVIISATSSEMTASFNSDLSSDDGEIQSYLWDFGNGVTSTEKNPSYTYTTPDTYQVSLTITDNNGKSTTAYETVTVNRASGDFSYFINELDVFFAASVDGANVTSYTWEFSDGVTGSGATYSRSFSNSGSYDVKLTMTKVGGGTIVVNKTINLGLFFYTGPQTYTGTLIAAANVTAEEGTSAVIISVFSGGVSYLSQWTINGETVTPFMNLGFMQQVRYTFTESPTPVSICLTDPFNPGRSGCTNFDVFYRLIQN